MALTPQSVRAKQFTPTRFKPGYDEDEVDAFLDEVEVELARLLEENASLHVALQAVPAPSSPAAAPLPAVSTEQPAADDVALEPAEEEPDEVPPAAPQGSSALVPRPADAARLVVVDRSRQDAAASAPARISGPPATPVQAELEEMLRRTLLLAQRTADEAVADARAEAERTVRAARAEADATVTAARQAAADQERDTAATRRRELSAAQDERQRLESAIEQLRGFERDHRARLRAYLQLQLQELGASGPAEVPPALDAGRRSLPGTDGDDAVELLDADLDGDLGADLGADLGDEHGWVPEPRAQA